MAPLGHFSLFCKLLFGYLYLSAFRLPDINTEPVSFDCKRYLKAKYLGPSIFSNLFLLALGAPSYPLIITYRTALPKLLKRAHFDKAGKNFQLHICRRKVLR